MIEKISFISAAELLIRETTAEKAAVLFTQLQSATDKAKQNGVPANYTITHQDTLISVRGQIKGAVVIFLGQAILEKQKAEKLFKKINQAWLTQKAETEKGKSLADTSHSQKMWVAAKKIEASGDEITRLRKLYP